MSVQSFLSRLLNEENKRESVMDLSDDEAIQQCFAKVQGTETPTKDKKEVYAKMCRVKLAEFNYKFRKDDNNEEYTKFLADDLKKAREAAGMTVESVLQGLGMFPQRKTDSYGGF